MDKQRGLFRVFTSEGEVRGTAFTVMGRTEMGMRYALTAYHVVSELMANLSQIYLEDEEGTRIEAKVAYPVDVCREYRRFSQDFAVLIFDSDASYQEYQMIEYMGRRPCSVIGAVPHYKTVFTALTGELLGVQKILPEREDVFQIQLKLPQISDKEGHSIPEQEIIRGISGAPILIEENGVDYCIGVFANLANDIQGSMQYGVPVNVLTWSNLFVHKTKRDVIKVPSK